MMYDYKPILKIVFKWGFILMFAGIGLISFITYVNSRSTVQSTLYLIVFMLSTIVINSIYNK